VAVVGLLWLTALFALDWFRLPPPPLPEWWHLPVPTVLLAGGLLLGLLLALVARLPARVGAARRRRRARKQVAERVEAVALEAVLDPVERELAAHAELRRALDRVRG
jgi:hypothetical protein